MGIFEDYARRYWENGYSIIPCKGKRAFLTNWNIYKDHQCSMAELNEWIVKYPNDNIGFPTGKANGIAVIDIDTNDKELLATIRNLLPNSQVQRFGKKGIAIFVKYSNQVACRINYKNKHIGEFITSGQVIVPPSIHPDTGLEYKWTGLIHLEDTSKDDIIEDLPEFTEHDFRVFQHQLDNENVEVDEKEFNKKVGRNDKLKSIVGSYIARGLKPDAIAPMLVIDDKLWHPDNPLFKDKSEFGNLANTPEACAHNFTSSLFRTYTNSHRSKTESCPHFDNSKSKQLEKGETYQKYEVFFDKHLRHAVKDKITGRFLIRNGYCWTPVLNDKKAIESYAESSGLKPHGSERHLRRYINEKPSELLCKIPIWDGRDRIKEIARVVKLKDNDNDMFEAFLKGWGAGIFARLDDPKNQNRCIILKGDQGIGKDYLIRALCEGLSPYYQKFTNNYNEREIWDQTVRNMVLHIEEFDQTSKLSIPFLKDMITRDFVDYRTPYDTESKTRAIRCSYISSVNIEDFFRDTTGNRRFVVFDVEAIDWDYKIDSGQIAAQFQQLFRDKFIISDEYNKAMKEIVDALTPERSDDQIVEVYLDKMDGLRRVPEHYNKTEFKLSEIGNVIDDLRRQFGWKPYSLYQLLRKRGLSKHRRYGTAYYCRKDVNE